MIRKLMIIALVANISLRADALACRPNTCDIVKCDNSEAELCVGAMKELQPNGGFCGCCPLCVTYIEENGNCFSNQLLGLPQKSKCIPGTECKDNLCQKLSSSC